MHDGDINSTTVGCSIMKKPADLISTLSFPGDAILIIEYPAKAIIGIKKINAKDLVLKNKVTIAIINSAIKIKAEL